MKLVLLSIIILNCLGFKKSDWKIVTNHEIQKQWKNKSNPSWQIAIKKSKLSSTIDFRSMGSQKIISNLKNTMTQNLLSIGYTDLEIRDIKLTQNPLKNQHLLKIKGDYFALDKKRVFFEEWREYTGVNLRITLMRSNNKQQAAMLSTYYNMLYKEFNR